MTETRLHITQGERAVASGLDTFITTILGSCVACCLWDPKTGVGGMNHMLLTVSTAGNDICNLAGVNAMELLINDILKKGGRRNHLRAKAFGGAQMVSGLSEIGRNNSEFILRFLSQEGITCDGHSLGGQAARHIMFWPASGRVRMKATAEAPKETTAQVQAKEVSGNGLELF